MNRTEAVSLAVRVVKQSGTTQHVLRRGDKYDVGASDRKGWKVAEMIGTGNVQNFEHVQTPAPVLISGNPIIHKTRFKELGYWKLGPGCWSVVDLNDGEPRQIGTKYATEKELLANLEAYATEYGCDDAMPKNPVRPIDRHYDGQAHYMAKAANSLVNLLNGLDYSAFELAEAARITAKIHGLINFIEAVQTKRTLVLSGETFPDRSRDDAGAADPRNDRED
jgi:hypothetical protein